MARSRKKKPASPRPSAASDERLPSPPACEPAPPLPVERSSGGTLFFAAVAAAILICGFWVSLNAVRVFCFSSMDSFWLIQAGKDLVARGQLLAGDIYSFTHGGKPWILYQWLFEVACGLLDEIGGFRLLQAFVIMMATLLFSVLALQGLTRCGVNFWIAWWVCASAAAASLSFVTLRPHLVSLLMVYLLKRLLDRVWAKPGPAIFWLAPLFLIWANCHIMFSIGLAMVLAYALCALSTWLGHGRSQADDWQRPRFLCAGFVVSLGPAMLNPYGWQLLAYGLKVSSQTYWIERIGEVQPPEFNEPVGGLILNYLLLAVLALMVSTSRPSLPEGLVFLSLLGAGLTSYKLLPYFVAATMHNTGLRLQAGLASQAAGACVPGWLTQTSRVLTGWSTSVYYPAVVLSVALVFALARPALFPPWVPVGAADYVGQNLPRGKLFCSAKCGSYLIYRFKGKLPVFIDTRFDMYGSELADRYFRVNRQGAGWQELFDEYGIEWAFVESSAGIAYALSRDPTWVRLYADEAAAVFVRRRS